MFAPIPINAAPNLATVDLGLHTAAANLTPFAVLLVNRNLVNEAFPPGRVVGAMWATENVPTPIYAVQSGGGAEAVRPSVPPRLSHVGEGSLAVVNAPILPFVAQCMVSVGLRLTTAAWLPQRSASPLANQQ